MSEYVSDYVLRGRSSHTPASFFSDNSAAMNRSRATATQQADNSYAGGLRSRSTSTNKFDAQNTGASRVPGSLGQLTPAFVPEMPTFGKPAFLSTLNRPNGRSQSPYGGARPGPADDAYLNTTGKGDRFRDSLTFGKNPLQGEAYFRDSNYSTVERGAKGFNGSTLDTASQGITQNNSNFNPFIRNRVSTDAAGAFNSPSKRSPTLSRVESAGKNNVYSDTVQLELGINTSLNRRTVAFTIFAFIVDFLVYYSFGQEDAWSFIMIVSSRFYLAYFVLEGQVKLMGMVPFDVLSFFRFKYFENSLITTMSILQFGAFMNLALTFDSLLASRAPRSAVENTFGWCNILIITMAYHYYSCSHRLINRFWPNTTILNLPRTILRSLSKPIAHCIGVFILTISFSWMLTWFIFALQDDRLLYGQTEVALDSLEPSNPISLTDLFSYNCLKSAVILFAATYVINIYAAMIQWQFCSVLVEGLLTKNQHDTPAINFCLYSDTIEGAVSRASTITDYHCLANLERYPKAVGELVDTLDTRQAEYGQSSTRDGSWQLVCCYTMDNLRFVRGLCRKAVMSEREERAYEDSLKNRLMYGVDSCDSFLNHARLETKERKFALFVANRGEMVLSNLRVFRIFVEKLQSSHRAETLMKNPLIQEVKAALQDCEMELADFLKLSPDNSGPSGRRFSYGFAIGKRIVDFQRQFCQLTSSIFLTSRH